MGTFYKNSDIFPLLQQGRFSDKIETERNRRTKKGKGRKQFTLQQVIKNKKMQTEEDRNGEARRTPKRVSGRLRAPIDLPFFYFLVGLECTNKNKIKEFVS